jgi:adenylate kinase family enzyme
MGSLLGEQRILLIGNPGSGKSVVARRLSSSLRMPLVELDEMYWRPGWTRLPDDQFRLVVKRATEGRCWVVDGVYPLAVDAVLADADLLVWLDLPFPTLLSRVFRRSVRRIVRRETICGGNRERWRDLFGRDSMPLYLTRTYRCQRNRFADFARQADGSPACRFVRLRSAAEVAKWLDEQTGTSVPVHDWAAGIVEWEGERC